MVADRNPHKQSKLLPGTHIPVVSPEQLMRATPDYVLVLPWNLQDEITAAARGHPCLGRPVRHPGARGASSFHDIHRDRRWRAPMIIDVTRMEDERGFFARCFSAEEFAARGLPAAMPQCSVSFNARKGTLRGMHFQAAPHAEDKLVRCTAGAIFDVIVDLRPESPTRRRWFGVELTAANRRSLFVPKGFAHGFITLRG